MNEARLSSSKYDRKPAQAEITPSVVKGCVGCGGEKFEPPKTPQEMEQVLREHIQGE